ncbi:MAG: molybdenum ABC transporter ATP-binding protein [Gammaproteobacteria bacterium]|nr:molybdenum ABC transporter ATP-binding protein [Gammaproteobacteria bacterium]MCY4356399.1 molybdenum ABC transporter ATP-binding protein [Gammaproteobacteria bacterium]
MSQYASRSSHSLENTLRLKLLAIPGVDPKADGSFVLDIDVCLPGRGVTAIYGASGSGKTTLLRCIAGLESVAVGELTINGDTWHNRQHSLPPHQRPIGYVFQEASLFQHLTVEGNLRFAEKRAHGNEMQFDDIVPMMSLQSLLGRNPDQLSGGERQRVAIARALLINPNLLLLDEPLAALDPKRRQDVLPYLERIHRNAGFPVLYVTHSIEEVTRLADFLLVLEQGRVSVAGEMIEMLSRSDLPLEIEEEMGVVLEGQILSREPRWQLITVSFAGGELQVRDRAGLGAVGESVRLRVLARDVSLALDTQSRSSILNRLSATVVMINQQPAAAMATVKLSVGGSLLLASVAIPSVDELSLRVGQQLIAQIKSVTLLH